MLHHVLFLLANHDWIPPQPTRSDYSTFFLGAIHLPTLQITRGPARFSRRLCKAIVRNTAESISRKQEWLVIKTVFNSLSKLILLVFERPMRLTSADTRSPSPCEPVSYGPIPIRNSRIVCKWQSRRFRSLSDISCCLPSQMPFPCRCIVLLVRTLVQHIHFVAPGRLLALPRRAETSLRECAA